MKPALLQLYLVTARYQDAPETFLDKIDAACANGVTLVQLREKNLSTRAYYDLALRVKAVTDRYRVPLIIDDRVDVCLAADAAGVHIGDSELPVAVTRRLLGQDKLLGVSAKTLPAAHAAAAAGADYLGVGAIYPTQTKQQAVRTSLPTLTTIATNVAIPVVAIGGIKLHNLASFAHTGVSGVAIVSDIMQAPDVAARVRDLRKAVAATPFD